jgi:hypothetical protein
MRLHEFSEVHAEMIEDESVERGDPNLLTALDFLKKRAGDQHLVPKIRVDALINMVQGMSGSEAFNLEALLAAFKTNDTVKNFIKDITDDDNGTKYVYLQANAEDDYSAVPGDMNAPRTPPEKTVGAMARSALANRS